jgi:hypothetical protein
MTDLSGFAALRQITQRPSFASCAGPSAHGSSLSDVALPSSGIHDHFPPRSTSRTEPV